MNAMRREGFALGASRRPEHRTRLRLRRTHTARRRSSRDLRNAEVEQLHTRRAVFTHREENVFGLQVAMHDPDAMRFVERPRGLSQVQDNFFGVQRLPRFDFAPKVSAAQKLHHEKRCATKLGSDIRVRHAHDVIAVDPRWCPRFGTKSLDRGRIHRHFRVQHFERQAFVRVNVLHEIDGPNAAFSKLFDDAISTGDDHPRRDHVGAHDNP